MNEPVGTPSVQKWSVFVSLKVENKSDEFVLYMVHESGGELELWLQLLWGILLFLFVIIWWMSVFFFFLSVTFKREPDLGMTNTHWWLVCSMDPVRKSPRSSSQSATWERKSHTMWVRVSCYHSLCSLTFFIFFSGPRHRCTMIQWANYRQFVKSRKKISCFRTDVTIGQDDKLCCDCSDM